MKTSGQPRGRAKGDEELEEIVIRGRKGFFLFALSVKVMLYPVLESPSTPALWKARLLISQGTQLPTSMPFTLHNITIGLIMRQIFWNMMNDGVKFCAIVLSPYNLHDFWSSFDWSMQTLCDWLYLGATITNSFGNHREDTAPSYAWLVHKDSWLGKGWFLSL